MVEEKVIEVKISDIFLWIALIIFLIIMAWWVLGSSPTTEILGVVFSFVGLVFAWEAGRKIKKLDLIEANSIKTLEILQKISER